MIQPDTAAATRQTPNHPPEALMEFILGLLTPLLMSVGIADARMVAQQTIAAYKAAGPDQLITIAQLVGFALASLDNLRLSMPAELSVTTKLKLRANANALDRASQRAMVTLDSQRRDATAPIVDHAEQQDQATEPDPDEAPRQASALASLEDARERVQQARTTPHAGPSATPDTERQRSLSWASAMTAVATEFSAELAQLPPAQRQGHLMRIGALSETALVLSRGDVPFRSQLLGSTSLRG